MIGWQLLIAYALTLAAILWIGERSTGLENTGPEVILQIEPPRIIDPTMLVPDRNPRRM